jgi:metal-responsive CopG/Arc/MetJ family transcriptional regulator
MLKKRSKRHKVTYSSVSLPVPLIDKIKETIEGSGYPSVSSFVEDLVRVALILRKEKKEIDKTFTIEYKKRIEQRLRALGYIG